MDKKILVIGVATVLASTLSLVGFAAPAEKHHTNHSTKAKAHVEKTADTSAAATASTGSVDSDMDSMGSSDASTDSDDDATASSGDMNSDADSD